MLYWMTSHDSPSLNTAAPNGFMEINGTDSTVSDQAETFLEQAKREQFTSADAPNLRVIEYWDMLVSDPGHIRELRERVLVGIPNYVRGFVWRHLSEASQCQAKNPELYQSLVMKPHAEFDEMIGNDVHRTFPAIALFADDSSGQIQLFGILRAYCNMSNEYSQCLAYIGAVLLMHMSEQDAFFVLVQMMKKYGLEAIFARDLPACLRNYSSFIEVSRPALFNHLIAEKLSVEIFVSGWLQTLFAQQFDLGLVFRLWDVFFAHGFLFFIKVSLVLLEHAEPALLRLNNTEIIFSLKSLPMRIQDFDRLIQEAMDLQIPDSILASDAEEDRLLTAPPTLNFDTPNVIARAANPRNSLTMSQGLARQLSSSNLSLSVDSGLSPTRLSRRFSSTESIPVTLSTTNSTRSSAEVQRTPGSGFIIRSNSNAQASSQPLVAKSPAESNSSSLSPLSASPVTKMQLV